MREQVIHAPRRLAVDCGVPGDKSIAHRALLLSSLAEGESRLANVPDGQDVQATMACLRWLGVEIERHSGSVQVVGRCLAGYRPSTSPLDCQNSGTTLRLLTGILAGSAFTTQLTGDGSLRARPMDRIIRPLLRMGAAVTSESGRAPLRVEGRTLHGVAHALPVPSAQVKSALLLAGVHASGTTTVAEPVFTRDHTERLLAAMGAAIERDGLRVSVRGGNRLRPLAMSIPGDFSSAAFWLAAAALRPGWTATIRGVGLNPTRTALLGLLREMGAQVRVRGEPEPALEPAGDITVTGDTLRAIALGPSEVASAIDEVPALMVLATQARGTTRIQGAGELRVKESDRITAKSDGLRRMGAQMTEQPDGALIEGPVALHGADVDAFGDHRVAMALAVAGLVADGPLRIQGAGYVAVSYPTFFKELEEGWDAG
jgi:3-phosphoshikimate 1-carboxyvinyltransferase